MSIQWGQRGQLGRPERPSLEPLVSVVVPTYGRNERLIVLLKQLLAQDAGEYSYEIIVVDDGSPQPVRPAVEEIGRQAEIPVRCLEKKNEGPAAARNFGARSARGEYLIFIDDDMSVRPDFIGAHVETQLEFGPALINCWFDWKVEAHPAPFERWYRRRVAEWTDARRSRSRTVSADVFEIPEVNATTANLSVRKIDFEKFGGFDTGYPFGCEDQDFGARAGRAGIRVMATSRSVALHIETHNTLRKLCRRQMLGATDTVRFVRRFAVAENHGEPTISKNYGPVRFGVDPPSMIIRKIARRIVGATSMAPLVFAAVSLIEKLWPDASALPKIYELVIGAHAQRGWREGLKLYGAERPLMEWTPAAIKS